MLDTTSMTFAKGKPERYGRVITPFLAVFVFTCAMPANGQTSSTPATDSSAASKKSAGWESPAGSTSTSTTDATDPKLKPYVKLEGTPQATSGSVSRSTQPTDKELDAVARSMITGPDILRLRKDKKAAKRLAAYHWLDKAADANPLVIEAICMHKAAAKILAAHPRLADIAEADHYVCRRITKWKPAARILAFNSQVREVAAFDPDGLYNAIARDKKIIRILSRNPLFDQMIGDNPDLGRVIAKYM